MSKKRAFFGHFLTKFSKNQLASIGQCVICADLHTSPPKSRVKLADQILNNNLSAEPILIPKITYKTAHSHCSCQQFNTIFPFCYFCTYLGLKLIKKCQNLGSIKSVKKQAKFLRKKSKKSRKWPLFGHFLPFLDNFVKNLLLFKFGLSRM